MSSIYKFVLKEKIVVMSTWSIIFKRFIIKTEVISHCSFLIMFCLVAYLSKMEEVFALIWSSGLIITIRGKRAI